MSQVLFPDASVVIHQENNLQRARILHPGEYIALEDLPDYQREAALAGKIPHARVIDKSSADLLISEAERMRNLSAPGTEISQFESGLVMETVERPVPVDDVEQEPDLG